MRVCPVRNRRTGASSEPSLNGLLIDRHGRPEDTRPMQTPSQPGALPASPVSVEPMVHLNEPLPVLVALMHGIYP